MKKWTEAEMDMENELYGDDPEGVDLRMQARLTTKLLDSFHKTTALATILSGASHQLIRIQMEGDEHASSIAKAALIKIDEGLSELV